MRILLTGATGFIGRKLIDALLKKNYHLTVLSRNPKTAAQKLPQNISIFSYNYSDIQELVSHVNNNEVIINLAGENIASKRWSDKQKEIIKSSRIKNGQLLSEAIRLSNNLPKTFIQASAIGYYPSYDEEMKTEESLPGNGFLSKLCIEWENSIHEIEDLNIRTVIIRTGLVLGRNEGVLKKFMDTFKFYIGGNIGNGNQWMSWIHIDDQINAILFLIENDTMKGVFNLTAPNPVRMNEFTSVLGKEMNRPSKFHIPAFVIRLVFGEMADEMILSSQKILPGKLVNAGFNFTHQTIYSALNHLINESQPDCAS